MRKKLILASLAGILPFTIALSSCNNSSNKDNSMPDKPNTPSNPNNPSNPDKPNEPNTPNNPDKPNEPNTPSKPNVPNNPNTPNNPDKPNTPSKPDKPNEPNTPSKPNNPNKPNPDKPNDKSEKYDDAKHRSELISLFHFNVHDYASNNFDRIKPLKNDKFNLTNIKISEIDDLKGFINLNIDGLYNNNSFSTSVKVDGFLTPRVGDKLSDDLNIKISNIKLIEENKTIDDLLKMESKALFDYFTELQCFTKDHNLIDVLNLLKETAYPSYSAPIFKIYKDGSDYFLKLQIKLIYKHYINSQWENKEVVIFENLRKALPNDHSYTKEDVLSYLLHDKVKFIKDIREAKKDFSYASEYKYFYEKIKANLDPAFVKFEKENNYKAQYGFSTFSYQIQSAGYDDLSGQLHLQVALIGYDKTGNETVSKSQEVTISGFKKLSQEYFFKNFGITEKNPKNPKWEKIKQELAELYNNSTNKEKFLTTDSKYFNSQNGYWNIIRPAEKGNIVEDNNIWNMIFLGTGQSLIIKGYDKDKDLVVDSNNNKFSLSGAYVEFVKIDNFQKENNKLMCDYHFKITFSVKNNPNAYILTEKSISIEKTITVTLN